MPCMRHSLLLCVLAVDWVFAQCAALADFNDTLQGSHGEVTYRKIVGAVANGTMPAVWLGGRAGSAVLLAVRKSVEEKFRKIVGC
jgi:hypothetical protein